VTNDVKNAANPTTEWLASVFGADTLWRPTEAPAALVHTGTLDFLRTVGFPAVTLDLADLDSTKLLAGDIWEADADEIFGRRYPDDDSPPTELCYAFAVYGGEYHLMVDGKSGTVDVYDPSGWDHAEGHAGHAFDGVGELAGAIGLLARFEPRFEGDGAAAALAELRAAVEELGWSDSVFWEWVFETLEDEYGDG